MAFLKLAAPSPRPSARTCRYCSPTRDFFYSRPPRPRFFSHKTSLLVVARPILRPQLPFLYPFPRGNTLQTHVGRFISTERKQRWREQFWRYVRINAYLWPAALLLTVLSMGMVHTKLERDYPTPGDWSFWSRWWMREAKFTELAEGAKLNQILTDWAKAGQLYLSVLERLESEKLDGQFLIKNAEIESSTVDKSEGFDVSAKSEQWRRGYHEALMGAARVAEHLEGLCKLKGDVRGGRVYPRESIPAPDNPRPKPLPYSRRQGHVTPPTLEEVEDAFPPPHVFYEKILNTIGFDTRQRLDAALAYADWCDFKANDRTAEDLYVKASEIAQSGLPAGTADVVDVQTGIILKGREDAVSDNILRACTAFGVHHVRGENVKNALPVFLSVLRARKTLPASPLGPAIGPSKVKLAEEGEGLLAYVYALKDLLVERPYPPPPPTGNERPYHTLKEACEEVGLMTYIGEILFATSASERAKGLSWTRDSVEAAEAIMWVMDEQKERDGRERCRECLETGLQNWKAMSQQMARLAAKKEQEIERSKGLFGLGLGTKQQLEKARNERRRWDEESLQVELRRQKTLPLLQEPLQPISGGWMSTRV
ncbi:uncharacterized protein A1O5_08685 [Cladophialophora psammophila CBS 110553]|uniref:Uncharacterized protein n=1 Tax=Cladophialophora psammophila CBS 110553 TaxID=1182543 RepID=W9WSS3_9EURO|nr:uncharacterized protein A1O5_08685 [Cladophialophora psammophila CBS 110553]EXJ68070.1 hypothetical protein A1O5_08685 [Cladophialophora psammophila CBS 110553]